MTDITNDDNRTLRRKKSKLSVVMTPKKKKIFSPELTVEDIYLQKDFVPSRFVGTSLETIYESPKARGTGKSLMSVLKLRRHVKFSPYEPSKFTISKRKNQVKMFKKLKSEKGKKSFRNKLISYLGVYKENSLQGMNVIPSVSMLNSVNSSPIESCNEPTVNVDNFTSTSSNILTENREDKELDSIISIFSSDLLFSGSRITENEDILMDDISSERLDLPKKAQNPIRKGRRCSRQFSSTTFIDFSENIPENSDSRNKGKTNKILEESNFREDYSRKRFHNLDTVGHNHGRISGKQKCGTSEPVKVQISPLELSSEVTNATFYASNDDRNKKRELYYTKVLEMDETNVNNVKSKVSLSEDYSLNSNSISVHDINLLPSPSSLNNVNSNSNKKSTNRRRSARLSRGGNILGSLWLDQ